MGKQWYQRSTWVTRRGLPNLPKARVKAPRRNEPKAKNYFSNKLLHSNVVITCLSSTRFVNFCVHVDIHILLWKIKDDVPYSKFDIENKKRITATTKKKKKFSPKKKKKKKKKKK